MSEPEASADSTADATSDARPVGLSRRAVVLWLLLIATGWFAAAPGLVSSNDGSHLALSRAQVLRGETTLGTEVALTLWVDRAKRDGKHYSDRPPGTAWLAAPAVWIGNRIDPELLQASLRTNELFVVPAATRYAETYRVRARRMKVAAPRLLGLQGTAATVALHTALVGVLGLWGVLVVLRRFGATTGASLFATGALGVASLWGPYATVLFSHVTAGTAVIWLVVALHVLATADDGELASSRIRRIAAAAGMLAGWAAATDYLVGVLAFGLAIAIVPRTRVRALLPWALLGALPVVLAVLAYHHAAFGSAFSLGYDHHANFEFARSRTQTFSGNPLLGAWSQWGFGEGAGMLRVAPVMLLGLWGLVRGGCGRWLLGALPWILLIAMHRTPLGGAGQDHRYLVPLLPLLAVGIGLQWTAMVDAPRGRWAAVGFLSLALVSTISVWPWVWNAWG